MSQLTLISHVLCPFVQRAAIILHEKGAAFDRVDIDLSAKPDWFLAISPTGKVPLLKVRTGEEEIVLFESVPICEYLDETQNGPAIHPDDPLLRARHRAWVEFGTGTLGEAWQLLNAKDAETASLKTEMLRARLATMEAALGDGPYFAGERLSMVDAVFAPIFRFFDALDDDRLAPIFIDLPRIGEWRGALRGRSSVAAAVSSDYAALLRAHLSRQGALLAA
jgi:glutathione S-transferase